MPFANTYEASGELNGDGAVKIEAQKTLSGRDMKDGEFRFRITNAEDEAEQKTVIAEGTNAAAEAGKAGAVEFGRITYTTKQRKGRRRRPCREERRKVCLSVSRF